MMSGPSFRSDAFSSGLGGRPFFPGLTQVFHYSFCDGGSFPGEKTDEFRTSEGCLTNGANMSLFQDPTFQCCGHRTKTLQLRSHRTRKVKPTTGFAQEAAARGLDARKRRFRGHRARPSMPASVMSINYNDSAKQYYYYR